MPRQYKEAANGIDSLPSRFSRICKAASKVDLALLNSDLYKCAGNSIQCKKGRSLG